MTMLFKAEGAITLSKEIAIKMTRVVQQRIEIFQKTNSLLLNTKEKIKQLDEDGTLTIPLLHKLFTECFVEVEEREKEYKKYNHLFSIYERFIHSLNKSVWERYFMVAKEFELISSDFRNFFEEYKCYSPKNKDELETKARQLLLVKGFVPDSSFEGDYATWLGVYARPKDKPTYLDANDNEEYLLQEKYSRDGFKQDFSEWFEWDVLKDELKER